jgi:hypothetical protein
MAGLDLRQRAAALTGGKRGAAFVPGKPEDSLLIRAVERKGDLQMPPGKQALPASDIATLREWIAAGAKWDESTRSSEPSWWSFRAPKRPAVPGPGHPIDAFIAESYRTYKLHPVKQADPRTLVRRAYFDLTGLPPTAAEIEAYAQNPDWEKLIDKLLASPRYGEKWGRHWLDVVRYADTGGFETDVFFPNAWRYRDYVIKSFNDDKPFNRFVQEQVAGDELWPDDLALNGGYEIAKEKQQHLEARIGTGMYTIGPVYHEAALDGEQLRYEWLTDVVDTTGEAFLGLTVGCSRCHDHKFDPLTRRDYHRMMAVFAGSEERDEPVVHMMNVLGFKSGYPNLLRVQDYKEAIARIDARARQRKVNDVRAQFAPAVLAAYDVAEAKRTPEQRTLAAEVEKAMTTAGLKENAAGKDFQPEYTAQEKDERERLIYQLGQAALKANYAVASATVLGHSSVVPPVYLTARGDFKNHGDEVQPGFPAMLSDGRDITEQPGQILHRRKDLAHWLTDPTHPLTARVMVNRLWHGHFGRGIVATPNDFGRQGEAPTHPELLDWLATEFVARGWSVKAIHRLIMTSQTYQLAGDPDDANSTIDANNRYLWRMNRRRLEAEGMRDAVLAVAGNLNLKMGGRPVIPKLTKEEESTMWAPSQWPASLDPREDERRSVYLYVKRSFPFPMFTIFDAPDTSVSCARRDVTTVAPQALAMLNGEFMLRQSKRLAESIRSEAGEDRTRQVEALWRRVYVRRPEAAEGARAAGFLKGGQSLAELSLVLLNTNEFVYVD